MLLDKGFLGKGQLEAEDKVGQRVMVQDVVGVKELTGDLEIEPEIPGAEAVERFAVANEPAHVVGSAGEQFGVNLADLLHQLKLVDLGEFF